MDMSNLIPIIMFICMAIVALGFLQVSYRIKKELQLTLRHAMDTGSKLDSDLIMSMANPVRSPEMDLRAGIMMTCLAIGCGVCSLIAWMTQNNEPLAGLMGFIALIILSLGAGNLISWKFRAHKHASPTSTL
jgi:Domain of unknown function (DUF6249)